MTRLVRYRIARTAVVNQPSRIAACRIKSIACVDELKCLPEDIEAIYSNTQIQVRIVHVIRHSLFYVSHKNRKEVAPEFKNDLLESNS